MKNRKNNGITLIELLVFVFLISIGLATASFLGRRFGYIGMVIGFPLGIGLVIGVLYVLYVIIDTIATLNFNRKSKLDVLSKALHEPQLDLLGKLVTDDGLDYLLSQADLQADKMKFIDLSHTNVSDRSLKRMTSFKNLGNTLAICSKSI